MEPEVSTLSADFNQLLTHSAYSASEEASERVAADDKDGAAAGADHGNDDRKQKRHRRRRKSQGKTRHHDTEEHQDPSEPANDHKAKRKGKMPLHKPSTPQLNKPPPFRRSPDGRAEGHMTRDDDSSKYRRKKKSKKRGETEGNGYRPMAQHVFRPFEPYWSLENVSHGLKRNQLIQGSIRINPKSYSDAFVDNPDGGPDILLEGMWSRNRALQGDIVAMQLMPRDRWKSRLSSTSSDTIPIGMIQSGLDSSYQDSEAVLADVSATSSGEDELVLKTPTKEAVRGIQGKSFDSLDLDDSQVTSEDSSYSNECAHDREQAMIGGIQNIAGYTAAPDSDSSAVVDGQCRIVVRDTKTYQKTGKVVYIIERKHSRASTGKLKKLKNPKARDALFSPVDSALPRINIPLPQCPPRFLTRPEDFANTLFIARITEWTETSAFARGELMRSLGEAGQIEPETEGILVEHDIDCSEFSQKVLDCLPKATPWQIPEEEIIARRDLRSECICTIDPSTARDLDDALSCKPLGKGIYEVGVHIADVSYFVHENMELDHVASRRATSVYMVQKVIPMLPRLLCEKLCSLNPNEDRLTFSFLWKINENGEILDEWCGRTIIRSCVKLSYEHAQDAIMNFAKSPTSMVLPKVTGGHSTKLVCESIINLNKVAVSLRKKRFEEGALRLDQVKLQFALDAKSGLPMGFSVYEQKDSNRLVEEFMLLANMATAHRIKEAYPGKALLRQHPPPKEHMMDELEKLCTEIGLEIDISSSGALQKSISKYLGSETTDWGTGQILQVLFSKPMQRAKYFCTGSEKDEVAYHHYALSVPMYTHFTSPIRRYADIIVHRQLAASLGCGPVPVKNPQSIAEQCNVCNTKKDNAKKAGELSSQMFFSVFVKECGPLQEDGMVMAVLDYSFDVLILKLGVVKRVYCNAKGLKVTFSQLKLGKQKGLRIVWSAEKNQPEVVQIIKLFSVVKVLLQVDDQPLKYSAIMRRPEKSDE